MPIHKMGREDDKTARNVASQSHLKVVNVLADSMVSTSATGWTLLGSRSQLSYLLAV